MQEAEGDNRQEGLWAKALTLEKGNTEQAKYLYVQLRVEQLQKAPVVSEITPLQPVAHDPPVETEPEAEAEIAQDNASDLTAESEELEKEAPSYPFATPPSDLTKYTVFALWALVVMSFVAILSDVMQLNLLENIRSITTEEADSNDQRVLIVEIIHVGIILIASVMVLVWKYKANENCHGFGAHEMRFTPGWAVGWNFVPFMNLFRPYQVMQEIWKVSSDPVKWQSQTGGTIIQWWWATCVISMLIGQAYSKIVMKNMFHDGGIRQLEQATTLSIATNCAILVSVIMTILVILAIHEKQKKLILDQTGEATSDVSRPFYDDDISAPATYTDSSLQKVTVQGASGMSAEEKLNKWPLLKKSEEDLFAMAHFECQSEHCHPGLWAKCIGESLSDEKKAEALYINYRAKQLMDERQKQNQAHLEMWENAPVQRACSDCGTTLEFTNGHLAKLLRAKIKIPCPNCEKSSW